MMIDNIFRNGQFWWPAYEKSPEKALSEVQRGVRSAMDAMRLVKSKRIIVQAGGHAGLVPLILSSQFAMVITYEAQKLLFDCMVMNIKDSGRTNIMPVNLALGDMNQIGVKLRAHGNSGGWRVDEKGTVPVEQVTIDSLDLKICDAIFLDVEGYEPNVLRGAAETIARCRPIIQCEMLPRSEKRIRAIMKEYRYRIGAPGRDTVFLPC